MEKPLCPKCLRKGKSIEMAYKPYIVGEPRFECPQCGLVKFT